MLQTLEKRRGWRFKECQRCGGDQFPDLNTDGYPERLEHICLQCGQVADTPNTLAYKKKGAL